MNKWLYRAVGAVGVASGALLLSNGVAHAQAADDARSDIDQQAMRGMVADFFTPLGQPREESIGGLLGGGGGGPLGGLTSRLAGGDQGSGLMSGLTGSKGPVGSLTGGLTGGLTSAIKGPDGSSPLSGLTSMAGLGGEGSSPLSALTSMAGLGGEDSSPLSALTGLLTGEDEEGPLSGVTGSLTGRGDGPLGEPVGGLINLTGPIDLAGTDQRNPIDPAQLRDMIGDVSMIVTDGPASTDVVVSTSLRGTTLDITAERPIQLNPDVARQVNDATGPMVQALIADDVAKQMGLAMDAANAEESPEENLPLVGQLPVASDFLGPNGSLKDMFVVGNVADGIPVVGQALNGDLDPMSVTELPIVNELFTRGLLNTGSEDSLPIVGSLPFVEQTLGSITDQATGATDGIWQQNPLGDLFQGGRPSTPGTNNDTMRRPAPTAAQMGSRMPGTAPSDVIPGAMPVTTLPAAVAMPTAAMPTVAMPTVGLPTVAMPTVGLPTAAMPTVAMPTVAMPTAAMPTVAMPSAVPPAGAGIPEPRPAATHSAHVGRHRATDRPEVVDPELEAAPSRGSLPFVGSLATVADSAMDSAMGTDLGMLPLSTLVRNVPLVSDVPLVGELGTPLKVLKALPLVGTLTGLVPVESDTAA